MIGHLFLFLYILTVGLTVSAFVLSLVYWMREKNRGRFNTLLFIGYLNILVFLAGVRFYLEGLIGGGPIVGIVMGMAEALGYALLIYYLPATINHIVGRRWTPLRLSAVITACIVYFGVGTVYHLTGFRLRYAVIAALIFFVALAVILADAARNIKKIRKPQTRITVSVLSLLTLIFLPLVMAGKVITEFEVSVETPVPVTPDLRFLFLTLYFFWMALTGIVFYVQELSSAGPMITGPMEISTDLPLTGREREVAKALAKGLTYGEIADDLDISPHTVRNHVANVYKKLAVRSKVELIGVLRGERE